MNTCCNWRFSLVAAGLLCLASCQSAPEDPAALNNAGVISAQLLQPRFNPHLLTVGDPVVFEPVFTLTDAQAKSFLSAFNHELTHLPEHLRLTHYLERLTASYSYRERTLTASEAFAGMPGNCISLVVLTTALAQLVNLEIDYQRMTTNPMFDRQNGLILVSDHVRSRVFAPRGARPLFQRAYAVIDYFPTPDSRGAERLDLNTLLALYYSNLSVESILDENLTAATQYAQMALMTSPDHPNALNLFAILHRRIADEETAEAYFQYALTLYPDDLNLLNNYHVLLTAQGRDEEAELLTERILKLNEVNPYHLMALAQQAFSRGEHRRALRYYKQVLELAPYLHEVYVEQAAVYESMGRPMSAKRMLERGRVEAARAAAEARPQLQKQPD